MFSGVEGGDTVLPWWFFLSRGRPCPGPFSQQVDYVHIPPSSKSHTDPIDFAEQGREGRPPRPQCNLELPHRCGCLWTRRAWRRGDAPRTRRGSLFPAGHRVLRRPQVFPARPDPPPEASGVSRQGWGRGPTTWQTAIGMSPSPEHFEASRSPTFPEGAPLPPPAHCLSTPAFSFSLHLSKGLSCGRDV